MRQNKRLACCPLRRTWALRLILMLKAFVFMNVFAHANETFRPFVGYSVKYNSNVLALPNKDAARVLTGSEEMGDTSHSLEGGLLMDMKLGRQNLTANFSASKVAYSRLSALDHDGRKLAANWNWQVGNHLGGNLGASYIHGLSSFTDFHQYQRSLRTQRREFVDGAWRFHPSWRIGGALSKYDLHYSLASQSSGDRSETQSQVGMDYISRQGNYVGLWVKHTESEYPNAQLVGAQAIYKNYQQNELKATADWQITGKTKLVFSGGHVSRTYDMLGARNYTGSNMRASVAWAASDRLRVAGSVWKETASIEDLAVVYSVNRGVNIAPQWILSPRSMLQAQYQYERRDFANAEAFTDGLAPVSGDTLRTASLTYTYRPYEKVSIDTTVFYGSKDANSSAASSYTRKGVAVNMRYAF